MKCALFAAVSALVTIASIVPSCARAGDWVSELEPSPAAWIREGSAQLIFYCDDDKEMVFKYRLDPGDLDAAIEGLPQADVIFAIDVTADGKRNSFWVTVEPFFEDDGRADFAFFGDVAVDWARLAMRAARTIDIGLSPKAGGNEYFQYNIATITAAGSTAALRPVVEFCG